MKGIRWMHAVLLCAILLQPLSASGSPGFTLTNQQAAHLPLSANSLLEEARQFLKVLTLSYTLITVEKSNFLLLMTTINISKPHLIVLENTSSLGY